MCYCRFTGQNSGIAFVNLYCLKMFFLFRQIRKNFRQNSIKTVILNTSTCSSFHNDFTNNYKPLTCLSEEELAVKAEVAKMAKQNISPYVREMEKEGRFKDSIIKLLFKNGLMGIQISPKYGGAGCNFMTTVLCIEEISKVDPTIATLLSVQNLLVAQVIDKLGTLEQKYKYLPRITSDTCTSFALSESEAGSDAFALKTTAQRFESEYVINGSKMWVSNADIAGLFLVMANANPLEGFRGITCFLVERDTPGLNVSKSITKLGQSASGTCIVNLDNVRVPASAILGQLGQGYKIASGFLNEGRIGIASQMLGLAQGCFDATIPHTFERSQFGKQIFDFQAIQHQISQIATEIECARLLVYNAARLVEADLPFVKQASMAKYYAAEVAQETSIKCIDWLGGVGYTKDFMQEKFYRDVKVGSIYEGTYNMQLNTIAKCLEKEYR